MLKIGDIYTSNDYRRFRIVNSYVKDQDPWVEYQDTDTRRVYSCRQEAFLQRFSLLVN